MTTEGSAYKIMALGPFAPVPEETFKPQFVPVDLYSVDEAVAKVAPVLYLPLSTDICPEGAVTLRFNRMKDFKPARIEKRIPAAPPDAGPQKSAGPAASSSGRSAVDDILSMVEGPETAGPGRSTGAAQGAGTVLGAIFSDPVFRRMESAWRGVQALVKQARVKGFETIRFSISPVSRGSLPNVLAAVEELPQEQMPNLLLIDLDFDYTQPSVELLEKVIAFSENMMIPSCVWLGSQFFRIDTWALMHKIPYIKHHMDDMSYAKFKKLKKLSGAAWVMACCNAFALRPPHEFETAPLTASPVWAAGILCAKSVHANGWPTAFTNYVDCYIENLPLFSEDGKNMATTQGLFSEDRIAQMLEAGLTAVVGPKNKDRAFVPKAVSMAGEPIKFQMFFNRIISLLMGLREDGTSWVDPAQAVSEGLKNLFTRTNHPFPDDLAVSVEPPDPGGGQSVGISFTPPRSVLAVSEKIGFSFRW